MRMTQEYKKFTKDEIQEIKNWANSHIIAIFQHFNVNFSDVGKYLKGKCPVPYHGGNGDNPMAFVWSFGKNSWRCYTHMCQEDTSSDAVGFVMSMKEIAFPQAIVYLHNLKNGELQACPEVARNRSNGSTDNGNAPVDKAKLDILMEDTYFIGRGISKDVLAKHKVGYWQKTGTFMDRRAIVPVFDALNNLVGFTGRITNKDEEAAKWVHGKDFVTRKAGTFNKTSVLYNLNNCIDVVKHTKKVFIVEGPIDVWKLEMAGITNVVATLGLGLSFEQQKLLISLGVEVIVICYDNDENHAGSQASQRILEQVGSIFKVELKLPANSKDYGEMNVQEILEALL